MASFNWPDASGGSVSGPESATQNALAKFADATGDVLTGTGIIVDASDNVSGMGTLGCGAITSSSTVTGTGFYATGTVAGSGIVRLANNTNVAWRNAGDSADITFGIDGSDEWNFNGTALTTTELGYIAGLTSSAQTQITARLPLAGGTMTGKITLDGDPTNSLHAATKQYVDAAISGVSVKDGVKAASTGNLTLSGEQTIDGVSCVTGDRVLAKDQSSDDENGIYIVDSGAWSRSDDANSAAEINNALATVAQGTANANTGWYQSAEVTTLGSDSVTFVQFFGAGTYTADGSTLSISGSTFSVANGGITNTQVSSDSGDRIAGTKIDPDFGGQDVLTTGSIGVGATTIDTAIHIEGGDLNSSRLTIEASGTGGSNAPGVRILNEGVFQAGLFYSESDDEVQLFGTNATAVMTVDSSDNFDFQSGNLTTTGDVGIGTTSPDVPLHVAHNRDVSPTAIKITPSGWSSGDVSYLTWETISDVETAKIGVEFNSGSGGNGDLIFEVLNAGSMAEAMRIASSGNVGIGTSSPAGTLDVNGTMVMKAVEGSANVNGNDQLDASAGTIFYFNNYSTTDTITNIINGVDGQVIYIINANTTNDVVLEHGDTSNSGQRIFTPDNGSVTLGSNSTASTNRGSVGLVYLSAISAWLFLSEANSAEFG